VLPVSRAGGALIVAMLQPTNEVIRELSIVTGLQIEPVLASAEVIRRGIERYYPRLN